MPGISFDVVRSPQLDRPGIDPIFSLGEQRHISRTPHLRLPPFRLPGRVLSRTCFIPYRVKHGYSTCLEEEGQEGPQNFRTLENLNWTGHRIVHRDVSLILPLTMVGNSPTRSNDSALRTDKIKDTKS